ncbi:MAG: DMT family transporter [Panacagrimonas sp.]
MSVATSPNRPSDLGYGFAAVTLLIWAGFVVVSRIGGQSVLTVFDIAALRIGTAALVLAPWWVPRLLKPRLRRLRWYQSLLFASLAGIGYPLVAFTGMVYAPASHGAVLISGMLPFFTSLLALLLIGERPTPGRMAGLGLILLGVATLFATSAGKASDTTLLGDAILLAASLIWSLFTVLLKRWQVRAFDVTLGVVAVSALLYLPVYALFLPKHVAEASIGQSLLQAFFQGFMVVCVALWSYAKSAELLGAVRTVIILSGVPVVGVLLSVAFLGETLSAGTALGAAVVFLGALIGAVAKPAPMAADDSQNVR